MYAAQLEVYKKAQTAAMSDREIEALVLTKAALQLKKSQVNWDLTDKDRKRSEALKSNLRVWSVLQGELANDDNPLPVKLREDLLSLSLFINKRTFEVMAFPSPEKMDILIKINLNLAAGLRGNPGQ